MKRHILGEQVEFRDFSQFFDIKPTETSPCSVVSAYRSLNIYTCAADNLQIIA